MTHQIPKLVNSVAGFQGRANDIISALCNVNTGSSQLSQFKVFFHFSNTILLFRMHKSFFILKCYMTNIYISSRILDPRTGCRPVIYSKCSAYCIKTNCKLNLNVFRFSIINSLYLIINI